jgi:hypothetical protein
MARRLLDFVANLLVENRRDASHDRLDEGGVIAGSRRHGLCRGADRMTARGTMLAPIRSHRFELFLGPSLMMFMLDCCRCNN